MGSGNEQEMKQTEIQMDNKHVKMYPLSMVLQKMQIKVMVGENKTSMN